MVNAASEVLRKGTIPAADGYGLVTAENYEERKAANGFNRDILGLGGVGTGAECRLPISVANVGAS